MEKTLTVAACALICVVLYSCSEQKRLSTGNYYFKYVDNQKVRATSDPSASDKYYAYKLIEAVKSKIEDKTDFLILKNKAALDSLRPIDSVNAEPPVAEKIATSGTYYSTETGVEQFEHYKHSFRYTDWKFAIQTLSIPLKFRKALDDGTKYPAQVETGINVGFAPVIKYNLNVFNPMRKVMGKTLNQYSLNTGLILNIGATDLKASGNAPGLKSDRKAPTFTYGAFLMFGVNNINFGYAVGWDKIIGEGHANWVYQNKLWHGVIIALDIIKP